MKIKVDIESFLNEQNEPRKQQVRQLILDDLKFAPKGLKTYFKAFNNDVDKALELMYRGYLAEIKVLSYLQQKNPNQNWHFLDNSAGYYCLDYVPTNKPDLINNAGTTVEVKRYKIYGDTVYFSCSVGDVEDLWHNYFHNADNVIVYSLEQSKAVMFNLEQFKENVSLDFGTTMTNYTWKLKVSNLITASF